MITISQAGLRLWWKEKKENSLAFSAIEAVTGVEGSYPLKGKHLFFFEGPRGVGVAVHGKESRKGN